MIFNMPETDLPTIRAAHDRGEVPALADAPDGAPGQERTLGAGALSTIDNAVDPNSGTIQLRATFPNQDGVLTAGQFVNVRLQVDTARGVVVPHTAVQHAQQGLFVFTVAPDKTVKRQDVTLVYDSGDRAVLSKGVADGDQVVTAGQTRIGAGTKVTWQDEKAPANAAPQQADAR